MRRYDSTKVEVSGILHSKDVQDFASKHDEFARQSLVVPNASSTTYNTNEFIRKERELITQNLQHYLRWRKWDEKYLSNPYTFAMISHVLTYPLTLASHAQYLIKDVKHQNLNTSKDPNYTHIIRLCCVGARSEAYLPDPFWREFLYFCNMISNPCPTLSDSGSYPSSSNVNPIQWHISFIGHDLPAKLKSRHISLNYETSSIEEEFQYQPSSIQMTFHSGLLHDYIQHLYKKKKKDDDDSVITEESILSLWDAFILFNPGIGHPNLISSWDPTLRFIFQTGKKVLLTSHSEWDSDRDWKILQRHLLDKEVDYEYTSNPFASLLAYDDPFPPEEGVRHVVRPNHSICWIG